jgi:hypothetical protein
MKYINLRFKGRLFSSKKKSKVIKDLIFKENRKKSGIYKWTNLINNKTYLVSSINLSKRFIKYFDDNALNNMLINKAITKHGRVNFSL